jgi:hypothetical protein
MDPVRPPSTGATIKIGIVRPKRMKRDQVIDTGHTGCGFLVKPARIRGFPVVHMPGLLKRAGKFQALLAGPGLIGYPGFLIHRERMG